jgi:hypothetical protein
MKKQTKSMYDRDFYKWALLQGSLLKSHEWEKLDLENVIEEIESLTRHSPNYAWFINTSKSPFHINSLEIEITSFLILR